MKRSLIGCVCVVVAGMAAVAIAGAYTAIGRARGEEWGSLAGPEPVWPAVIGFGGLWAIALGAAALLILVAVALVRELWPRSSSHDDGMPKPAGTDPGLSRHNR